MKKLATLSMALLVALVFSGTIFAAGSEEKTEEGAMDTPQGLPGEQGHMPVQPPVGAMAMPVEGEPMAVLRADAIIGLAVINEQGQQLGEVEDLIVTNDGRIGYLVISRGGLLGFGSKLCAIPWDAANARIHEYALIVGLSKEQFESAPTFESWAELGNSDYEQQVRAYYGEESGDKGAHPGKMEPGMSGSETETGNQSKPY
jgi:sporulation protein YlmC with PRC-barrel domain